MGRSGCGPGAIGWCDGAGRGHCLSSHEGRSKPRKCRNVAAHRYFYSGAKRLRAHERGPDHDEHGPGCDLSVWPRKCESPTAKSSSGCEILARFRTRVLKHRPESVPSTTRFCIRTAGQATDRHPCAGLESPHKAACCLGFPYFVSTGLTPTDSRTGSDCTWPSSRSGSGAAGKAHPSLRRWIRDDGAWCCRSACARTLPRIP